MHHADPTGLRHSQRVIMMHQCSPGELLAGCIGASWRQMSSFSNMPCIHLCTLIKALLFLLQLSDVADYEERRQIRGAIQHLRKQQLAAGRSRTKQLVDYIDWFVISCSREKVNCLDLWDYLKSLGEGMEGLTWVYGITREQGFICKKSCTCCCQESRKIGWEILKKFYRLIRVRSAYTNKKTLTGVNWASI